MRAGRGQYQAGEGAGPHPESRENTMTNTQEQTMTLIVNGDPRPAPDGATLAQYLDTLTLKAKMVVVERNGTIVPRDDYAATYLTEGDTLEIVQMMAGG